MIIVQLDSEQLSDLIQNSVERAIKAHLPATVETDHQKNRKHAAPGAANFLGIALATLYTKVSKGELPVCKAPGSKRLFFFENDLLDYLQSGRKLTNIEIEQQADQHLTNKRRAV